MLDQLTSADFAPYVNQAFTIRLEGIEPIGLELVSVTDYTAAGMQDAPRRQPFSLHFLGPVSRQYLQQHIYQLEHEQMGMLELFLVPLGLEGGRMRYEAIFN